VGEVGLMKKILFGLFLYFFLSMTAEAVFYLAWKHSDVDASPDFFNGLDGASLDRGKSPEFGAVVFLLGEGEEGTGILIEPPEDRPDLAGRLVLTAAHVIRGNAGKRLRIHPKGLLKKVDEPSEENLLETGALIEIPPGADHRISHPGFVKDDESTRQFDYGLIILEERIDHLIPSLHLANPEEIDLDSIATIEVAGFGSRLNMAPEGGIREEKEGGFRKRAFESIIGKKERNVLELDLGKFISAQEKAIFTFPFSGDSGGAVFKKGEYSRLVGVVSGVNTDELIFKYVHVTNEDVRQLLDLRGAK
jgi:hypothetical protein